MTEKEIRRKVKKALDHDRYEHTKGVMYTAAALAMAYDYPLDRAMLAGLLHDCAKCVPNEKKIRLCEKHNIPITDVERQNPTLLHSKLGAFFAADKYGIEDPEICHAIEVHTTGEPNMNLLDKIIFVADYIEPGRDRAPHLAELRKLAFRDLDACIADILYDTLHYLAGENKKGAIDPATQKTYEYYADKLTHIDKQPYKPD